MRRTAGSIICSFVMTLLMASSSATAESCTGETCQQTCTPTGCLPIECSSAADGDCFCTVTSKVIGPDQVVNTCRSYYPCSLTCPGDGTGFPIAITIADHPMLSSIVRALRAHPALQAAVEAAYDNDNGGFHPHSRILISHSLPGVAVPLATLRVHLETNHPAIANDPGFESLLRWKAERIHFARSVSALAVVLVERHGRDGLYLEIELYDPPILRANEISTISAGDPRWTSSDVKRGLVGTIDASGAHGTLTVYDRTSQSESIDW